jgi:hypothetical protein
MTRSNVAKLIDAAAKRAGLPHCHPHQLRHTCGHLLADAGHDTRRQAARHHQRHVLTLPDTRTSEADKSNAEQSTAPANVVALQPPRRDPGSIHNAVLPSRLWMSAFDPKRTSVAI